MEKLQKRLAELDGLEHKHKQEIQLQRSFGTLQGAVHALTATVELLDPELAAEQRSVARLAIAIGRNLGLPEEDITGIGLAATLHDLGKVYISREILGKNGKLTKEQFGFVEDHPEVGYNILKTVELGTAKFPWPIAEMVQQHHERMDGSGYPNGLFSDNILLGARIIAVAEVVIAMCSDRPHRPALGIDKALEELRQNRGSAYDVAVVDACEKLIREGGSIFE